MHAWCFSVSVLSLPIPLATPVALGHGSVGGGGGGGGDALEGKTPEERLNQRLEEVAKAVGGGYCRLQLPLKLALAVRGTVAGHRLGALEGGYPPPFKCIPGGGGGANQNDRLVALMAMSGCPTNSGQKQEKISHHIPSDPVTYRGGQGVA